MSFFNNISSLAKCLETSLRLNAGYFGEKCGMCRTGIKAWSAIENGYDSMLIWNLCISGVTNESDRDGSRNGIWHA